MPQPPTASEDSLSSLQGAQQLGEHNCRGNAARQADKRELRDGLRGWSGLSVCLSLCQNKAREEADSFGDSWLISFTTCNQDGDVHLLEGFDFI